MKYTDGVDVSVHQDGGRNEIYDVKALYNAGYRFVILRACYEMTKDEAIDKFFNLFFDAGFIIGFYQYPLFNSRGEDVADFFLETVAPYIQRLENKYIHHHLDIERYFVTIPKQTYSARARVWLEYVSKESKQAGIYSNASGYSEMTGNASYGKYYYNWLAQWNALQSPITNDPRYYPTAWDLSKLKFWQWAVAGHPAYNWMPPSIPGVKGQIDLDRFLGSVADLRKLAGYDQVVPEPEPEPEYLFSQVNVSGYNLDIQVGDK